MTRLLQAVEMWDRAEWCRREIHRLGLTLTDRFGQEKPNPLCDLERKLRVSVDDIIHRLPKRQTIADLESELKDLGQ